MYTTSIDVDLSGQQALTIVYAKQGDVDARQVDIGFLDRGAPYTIPQGTTARIWVRKPDGTAVYNTCEVSGDRVIAPLSAQTLAAAGWADAEIALYQGDTVLLSCSVFRLAIAKNARSEDAAESSNEFGVLDALVSEAETSIPAATAAAAAASSAAQAATAAAETAEEASAAVVDIVPQVVTDWDNATTTRFYASLSTAAHVPTTESPFDGANWCGFAIANGSVVTQVAYPAFNGSRDYGFCWFTRHFVASNPSMASGWTRTDADIGNTADLTTAAKTVVGAINELEGGKLPYRVETTNTHVDALTEDGYYTGMISGLPGKQAGGVLVSNLGNEVVQTVFSSYENGKLFRRWFSRGSWGSFYKILDNSDISQSLDVADSGKAASAGITWYLNQSLGDVSELTTTAKTAVGAINELNEARVTRYGVKFAGEANSGESVSRLYDAVGLAAGVGTDTEEADNDFDSLYPWSARRRCCGEFDAAGRFQVHAYAGEPGYATDGSNGEVWVEHSLFYYKHENGDDGSEEVCISPYALPGYAPAPLFVNADGTLRQKAYTAAYPLAIVDGKATSRSGVFPDACSLDAAMTSARALGEQYTVMTMAEWYTEWLYMVVEFATRDVQRVMKGADSLPYSGSVTAVLSETGVTRVVLPAASANQFAVGQTIGIGSALGGTQTAANRVVTAITDYDADNRALSFDGEAVDIAAGSVVWSAAWKNGSCDGVLSTSGSPVSNTDGRHTCVYRGKESPYGNAFEWVSDLLVTRSGAGTAEDPYAYAAYYLPDPTKYAEGAVTEDYVELSYTPADADGYVTGLGLDSRFPHVRLPQAVGGSATTGYADYYSKPAYDVCGAAVGGHWYFGWADGPCCWHTASRPAHASVDRVARLSCR